MTKLLSFWSNLFAREKTQTILVIDDSDVDRRLSSGILKRRYHVLDASSSREGLALAREKKPDVILLDFEMPDLKGPEVCKMLKMENDTKDIPVVLLTAYDMPATVIDSFDGGADMYLTKPIHAGELFRQIELAMETARVEKGVSC